MIDKRKSYGSISLYKRLIPDTEHGRFLYDRGKQTLRS